tara:strand:+ start:1608 stop:1865 length:258 start_codon:yes stop_codon:yes gene_type:complete
MENKMAKDTKAENMVSAPASAETAAPIDHDQIYQVSTQMGRSMIAVIDAVAQRGGFRGEELSTIGQLRDQCVKAISLGENYEAQK